MFERLRLQASIIFGALRTSGLRSLMVVVAVAVGSTSLVTTLAMSAGTQSRLRAFTEMVGRDLLMIKAGRSSIDAESELRPAHLTVADAAALDEEIADVQQVLPVVQRGNVTIRIAGSSFSTTVLGVTERYFAARNWHDESGRLIDSLDDTGRKRVAVVGATVADSLHVNQNLLGATLLIADVPFEVVGQLREKGLGYGAINEDSNIYVPLQSAMRRLFNLNDVSHLLVQVRAGRGMPGVESAATEVLRRNHRLQSTSPNDFEILQPLKQNSVNSVTQALVQRMTQLLSFVLLVLGGIGVFAVTYLSVMQRKPEIGLRRALGARQRDIAALFTSEACLLSTAGGFVGCVLGGVLVFILARWGGWPVDVDLQVMLLPLSISLLIGIVFGVVPALRAGGLPPVEALRAS